MTQRRQPLGHGNSTRNHLGNTQKSVLKHKTFNIANLLVLRNQINRHSTANTLPENNNLVALQILAGADIIKPSLRIDDEALLVGGAGGEAVAAVLEHQHGAVDVVCQDAAYRQAVADVACVSVEEQDGNGAGLGFVVGPQEEGAESFAVGGWEREFFVVVEAVFGGPRDLGAGSGGNVAWVDDLAVGDGYVRVVW
jgi:hypothetical protein